MEKIFVGIDPGKCGAWCLYQDNECFLWGSFEERAEVFKYLEGSYIDCYAILERVSVRPGEGNVTGFHFGRTVGIWQGALEALKIPYCEVPPQTWQKIITPMPAKSPRPQEEGLKEARARAARDKANRKEAIAEFAKKRFPSLREVLALKKNWGIADAACMALWGSCIGTFIGK
jgi:crossover junction endodeoxyribonuclease RuvC